MKEEKKEGGYRAKFPEQEKRHPWLARLLDAYEVIDEGVARAVAEEEKKKGKALACRRGCDACCAQQDIPVYPHELTGIYWYCMEVMRQPTREVLRQRLLRHRKGDGCPLLLDGACVVHPLRPAGCRQFNVFGTPCAEGEDPFHTRREDVLTPNRNVTRRAFSLVLSLYGLEGKAAEQKGRVEEIIRGGVVNLQGCDWKKLGTRMAEFDGQGRGGGTPE